MWCNIIQYSLAILVGRVFVIVLDGQDSHSNYTLYWVNVTHALPTDTLI